MPLNTARRQKVDRRAGQSIARTSIAVHRKGVAPAKHETSDAGETHIYFACPECDKRMRVRKALAGKRGACPSCQARFVFPEGAVDECESKAAPASAKKPSFSGLRNAVIGSSPEAPLPAKPVSAAPQPSRNSNASDKRIVVKSSFARQPAVQPAEPVVHSQPQGESARVLVGTALGLLVGIFAGFVIGKNFAPARENPVAAVQAPAPSIPHETTISPDMRSQEPSSLETEDLTPSITEKAPTEVAAAAALPPEPAPIEKTAGETHQRRAIVRIRPVEPEHEAPAPEPAYAKEAAPVVPVDEPEAALQLTPVPARAEKAEVPAKEEQEPAIAAVPERELTVPPVVESAAQVEAQEPTAPAAKTPPVTSVEEQAVASPEPQTLPERSELTEPETKPEPAKPAVSGRPVFARARDVHDYVDKRYQGDDGKYKLTLILVNKRGEERTSQMVRYRYERDHLSKVLLTYVSPADVRGTTTMTIEQKDADDIQRIYIPSMKKNRRIASSDKGRSWAGTDFTYEDLQEHEVDDWNYGELKTDTVDGHECYFYVTTPVTPDKSCYSRIENWVRKDILEPVRAKYWDEKGKYLKELNFRDLHKIQGIWSAMYWEMENAQEGHKTVFKVEKVIYNTGLKEDMFTPRSMVDVPLDF